ncbi:MAG: hypothetical protein D6820_16850, partial [Lentisphaerae bacterium]
SQFEFAADGVHPGREGHWLMAREIILQVFGFDVRNVPTVENMFAHHGGKIRELVEQRMRILWRAWMTRIGHSRPHVPGGPDSEPGPPLPEAEQKALEIGETIAHLLE